MMILENLLAHLLKRYDGTSFVVRLKARFVAYCSLTEILVIGTVIIVSGFAHLNNPLYGYSLNFKVLGPLIAGLSFPAIGLWFLARGNFTIAAHMLLVCGFVTTWTVIFLDRSYVVSRLDSISLIIGLLSMTPLIILKKPLGIIFYSAVNIVTLYAFMFIFRDDLNLPYSSFIDYLSDNTVTLLAVTVIAYNVYSINRRTLEKAETDIAERIRTEELLVRSEEKFSKSFHLSPLAIILATLDGARVAEVSDQACRLLGIERGEIMGRSLLETGVLRTEGTWDQLRGDLERDGIILERELGITTKAGSARTVLASAEIVTIGAVPHAIIVAADITEKKAHQEERARLEDQLRQSQKMESIGQMAGGIAHDFNNLLTAILGHAELGLMNADQGGAAYPHFLGISKAAESAATLTRQLLAFSRKQVIEPRTLDLNELIAGMQKMLARVIGEHITLKTVMQQKLWKVRADPGQIEQVVINLAVNARDAMPDGGRLAIETMNASFDEKYGRTHLTVQPGEYVMLSVSDTGTGMDEEVKRHLFEPFFTTKPKGKGTGLGLATIYGAVRQNNGTIEVYSEPGMGTTFKVYFPRIAAGEEASAERRSSRTAPGGTETILLVEDDDLVLRFSLSVLKNLGYTVISSSTAEEALRAAARHEGRIDMLLTDVVLPGMNGRALAEKLIEKRPECKVLYASGYTEDVVLHHGVLQGDISFIAKPFSPQALAKKIREVLDG
ncbi:MAG: response regulator [Spirochaetes bacterium]|nr:MAG: response regulator [Spirochaetota bacterium]